MAGRKNIYEEKIKPNLHRISAWKRQGAEDKAIMEQLEVSSASFYKYLAKEEEFKEALKKSAEDYKIEIENILYEEAVKNKAPWAVSKILDKYPEWGITSKDKKYFALREREIQAKEKANDIEEQKIDKVIGDTPDD